MTGLPPISVIARDLGAPGIKDGRCAAWYRGGRNPRSLTLDDRKQAWYDHGAQHGGGIIDLVMLALGCCDRREAVAWLRRQYGGLTRPTSAQREKRQAAHSAAEDLAEWLWRLVQHLRAVRNSAWDAWQAAERQYRGTERTNDLPASEWRELRQRLKNADGIDNYVGCLQALSTTDLLALRSRLEATR